MLRDNRIVELCRFGKNMKVVKAGGESQGL
jgi:hypothetical protein